MKMLKISSSRIKKGVHQGASESHLLQRTESFVASGIKMDAPPVSRFLNPFTHFPFMKYFV